MQLPKYHQNELVIISTKMPYTKDGGLHGPHGVGVISKVFMPTDEGWHYKVTTDDSQTGTFKKSEEEILYVYRGGEWMSTDLF